MSQFNMILEREILSSNPLLFVLIFYDYCARVWSCDWPTHEGHVKRINLTFLY